MKDGQSLSRRILIGVAVGIAIGIFAGEHAAALEPVADGYIKLLQMTVLPYVTVSIISGLGALNLTQARLLGARVVVVLLLFWLLALTAVFLFPLMFPSNENASFFSTALVEERESFNFIDLYIPANPFNSLANNVVPAVVLFSIIVGVALISIPDKAALLSVLAAVRSAVSKATELVVALSPLGMCAIGAVVAGTLSFDDLERLQVYLASYTVMSLLVSLWVLPGLVATLTPVPYRALMSQSRDALLLAFMTTSLFAVLPILTERAKALVREHVGIDASSVPASEVIVPASFNLPHTGKILSLSFVLFAGWYADAEPTWADYPKIAGTGLLAMFGSANAAIPFLLDLSRLPADLFHLFVASGVVNARVGSLVAAVHTLAIAVLGTCAVAGGLTIDARKIARFAVVTVLLAIGVVGGTRLALHAAASRPYSKDAILTGMRLRNDGKAARVFRDGEVVPPLPPPAGSLLDRARQRGVLRIGYFDDSLPYAFVNRHRELVGFDVDMGLALARDLSIGVELVPVSREILMRGLDASVCDIVMSGVVVTVDRAMQVQFSAPYLDETIAFIVPDHRAAAFSDWSSIRAMERLRVGAPNAPYYTRRIRDELRDIEIVPINSLDEMFKPHDPPIDAFLATAERGSAYTLLHPAYSVAVPRPRPLKVPMAYVIANRDTVMTSMVNTWLEQKRRDGTIDELFSYWILGQDAVPRQPRWSVMRNVLHWSR